MIVFNDGERSAGILVDQVLDIAEETVTIRQQTARPGLLGSAVVGGKVTDFLDLHFVLENAVQNWFGEGPGRLRSASVLVADGSSFSRIMVRNYLEIAGHRVAEASSAGEVLDELERGGIDVVLAAVDLPGADKESLVERMRGQPGQARIPVILLTNPGEQPARPGPGAVAPEDYRMKFDQEAMLRSIEKLATAVNQAEAVPELVGQED